MAKYLALLWVAAFLILRGLLLFNTSVDYLLLLAGALFFYGWPDGEFEVLEKQWQWYRRQVAKYGNKNRV